MRVRSVSELLAKSDRLGHLAAYVEPGHALPSRSDVKDVWLFLAQQILPSIANSRASRFPLQVRDFKKVETLALAAQIDDFSLKDYEDPSLERWHSQLACVDAFMEVCHELCEGVSSEIETMKEAAALLDLYKESLKEAKLRVAVLQRTRDSQSGDEHEHITRERESLAAQVKSKENELESLQAELNSNLLPEESRLGRQLQDLENRCAEFAEHVALLRPVLARGVSALRPEITNLAKDVELLESQERGLKEMATKCELTLQVFSQLEQELLELRNMKAQVLELKTKKEMYKGEKVSQIRQQKDHLTTSLQTYTQQCQQLKVKLEEITQGVEKQRKELAVLQTLESDKAAGQASAAQSAYGSPDPSASVPPVSNAGSKEANDELEAAEESIKIARARVEQLTETNKSLTLTVKSQKKWLKGMEALEKEGKRLEEELDVVKTWMKLYLKESES